MVPPSCTTLISFLPLFFLPLFASSSSSLSSLHAGSFSKIYAFGDSYTDTGNTGSSTGPSGFAHVSHLPYGMTYFHRPTNRYSDGRLLVDFLAEALSLPLLPPYLNRKADLSHGVNFAVAGATAINHEFFVRNNVQLAITQQSLGTELQWFNEFMKARGCGEGGACGEAMKDALFWVGEIGANDYAYSAFSTVSNSTVQELALGASLSSIKALLAKGAKYVVVQGLPMIGCLPLSLVFAGADDRDDVGCVASQNQVARTHNYRLISGIRAIRSSNPAATVAYADYWAAHRAVMTDPTRFGIRERFWTCCGTGGGPYNFNPFTTCGASAAAKACAQPSKYVNWDGVHFTEGMYEAIAGLLLSGPHMDPPFVELVRKKKAGV